MLNIISHQGNTNQNHHEIPLHTHQDGDDFKKQEIRLVSLEKLEPSHTAGGNVKWCSCDGKKFGCSSES